MTEDKSQNKLSKDLQTILNLPVGQIVPNPIESFKALKKRIKELQEEAQQQSKKIFTDGLKILFDKHPNLHVVHWSQSTPSWNDGEPCYFGINGPNVNFRQAGSASSEEPEYFTYMEDQSSWDEETDPENPIELQESHNKLIAERDEIYTKLNSLYGHLSYDGIRKITKTDPMFKETFDFLAIFDEDDYKWMWGDGTEVTITRSGIHTQEYEEN